MIPKIFLLAPIWVWPLFAYMISIGLLARKKRTMPLFPMAAFVVIFFSINMWQLSSANLESAIAFLSCLFVGTFVGYAALASPVLAVDKKRFMITVPGENYTLILFTSFFAAKFVLGALTATVPAYSAWYTLADAVARGLFVGVNLGRLAKYVWVIHRS